MNDEARQILAFIFRRSGKETLPASDVYLAISMELQWCSPKEAKAFVKKAVAAGLLKENDHGVTPSFMVEEIEIPTGFSPSEEVFKNHLDSSKKSDEKELYSMVISRLAQKKQMSQNEINNAIEKISTEKKIEREVAAVFFARKMQCNIHDLLPDLEKIFF